MTYKDVNAMILVVLTYAAAAAIAFMLFGRPTAASAPDTTSAPASQPAVTPLSDAPGILFTCGDKNLRADFSERSVRLALSDGRRMTLPQAISASGARYANPDESFVFWNKGNTAFIEEYGETTYTDCVTSE